MQRVSSARVRVADQTVGAIDHGLLVLCAFRPTDTAAELDWMARKLRELRVFNDDEGLMNRSLRDVGGGLLVVSQFTLYGDARKGRRPGFADSAPGPVAEVLYDRFVRLLQDGDLKVQTGRFAAHMQVELCNDGPVTLILDRDAEAGR